MAAIINLQQRTSETTANDKFSQTMEISVKPVVSPKPPTPRPPIPQPRVPQPPVPQPSTPPIEPGTIVYAMWFADDALAYEVNEISVLNGHFIDQF